MAQLASTSFNRAVFHVSVSARQKRFWVVKKEPSGAHRVEVPCAFQERPENKAFPARCCVFSSGRAYYSEGMSPRGVSGSTRLHVLLCPPSTTSENAIYFIPI